MTGAEVVAEARSWIGTPWHHQGRTKGVGVDCVGLLVCVARALGLADVDVSGYGRRPDGTMLSRCDEHMQRIDMDRMRPGDVLIAAWGREAQHIGILGDYRNGGLSLIHAENHKHHRVLEHRLAFDSSMRFVRAYRLPGVE